MSDHRIRESDTMWITASRAPANRDLIWMWSHPPTRGSDGKWGVGGVHIGSCAIGLWPGVVPGVDQCIQIHMAPAGYWREDLDSAGSGWRVVASGDGVYLVEDSAGTPVAHGIHAEHAHLIAAALKMRASLERVLGDADIYHDPDTLRQVEAALRAARGETGE